MSKLERFPFPEVLDSSMMSSFRSCPRKWALEYGLHYKPVTTSVHLHAGGAYAKGLEKAREAYFQHGLPADQARAQGMKALFESYGDFQCPSDSAKSLERMAGALEFYFERYPLETDPAVPITLPGGQRGIEFSFAEPLEINNPETGSLGQNMRRPAQQENRMKPSEGEAVVIARRGVSHIRARLQQFVELAKLRDRVAKVLDDVV